MRVCPRIFINKCSTEIVLISFEGIGIYSVSTASEESAAFFEAEAEAKLGMLVLLGAKASVVSIVRWLLVADVVGLARWGLICYP